MKSIFVIALAGLAGCALTTEQQPSPGADAPGAEQFVESTSGDGPLTLEDASVDDLGRPDASGLDGPRTDDRPDRFDASLRERAGEDDVPATTGVDRTDASDDRALLDWVRPDVPHIRSFSATIPVGRVTCAWHRGQVWCWWYGADGLPIPVEDRASDHHLRPTRIVAFNGAEDINLSRWYGFASIHGAGLMVWENPSWDWPGVHPPGPSDAGITLSRFEPPDLVGVPVGYEQGANALTLYVRDRSGAVYGWGDASGYALARTPLDEREFVLTPTRIPLPAPATDLSGAFGTACAIASGRVYCWGHNDFGQTGQRIDAICLTAPSPTCRTPIPTLLSGLPDTMVQVVVTDGVSFARSADGQVYAWGHAEDGRLGDGLPTHACCNGSLGPCCDGPPPGLGCECEYSAGPIRIPGLSDVVDLDAAMGFACAVRADGTVWCWGRVYTGAPIGVVPYEVIERPRQIAGLSNVVDVSLSSSNRCAVTADGGIWCWGADVAGELSQVPPYDRGVHLPTRIEVPWAP